MPIFPSDTSQTTNNDIINQPFTTVEIKSVIKMSKNNKSPGAEFFKHCHIDCINIIVDFLNIVLYTGLVPTEWCLGIINPIYKNKGPRSDPDNYRGITLLSCTCKLFTACINKRLSDYVQQDILGEEQAGFRHGYNTIDHIYVLQTIIELYQSVYKRVYCAFIDYRKAFDSLDRSYLCQKLLSYNVNGKIFHVIKNMYAKAKSCIKKDNLISGYFPSNIGVRQGDNLSPLLFALFINDFKHSIANTYPGLNIADSCYPTLNDNSIIFIKVFVLLYADDTIVLAENEHQLQIALDTVHQYCTRYNLSVNINKTKIVVFSRGKVRNFPMFKYGSSTIEVVSEYVYLGVTMMYSNKYAKAMKKQMDQARKAQFALLINARKLCLPIDIQCDMFEKVVSPILLYGSEVWGFSCTEMLEIFHRNFLKKILHLRPSTPNCMVYGELGVLPLQVAIDKRIIRYWFRLLCKHHSAYSYCIYRMALTLFSNDLYKTHWICKVKSILDNCGLSYMWENQCTLDNSTCKNIIFRHIDDIALNRWYTDLSVSSLCTFYRQFKQKLCFEKYLLMSNSRERISLTKYRCTNSKLPIYKHIYLYDSDICTLCNLNSKGDEYHYILICPSFRKERELYLKKILLYDTKHTQIYQSLLLYE